MSSGVFRQRSGLLGSGGGFGVDADWDDVTIQVNFSNFTTADLDAGFLDETGNHTCTFDGSAEIDNEGHLINGDMFVNTTTDDGAFNNIGSSYVEGQASTLVTRPGSYGTGSNFSKWGYAGGWRGWITQTDGALYINGNNVGSHTGLQSSTIVPSEELALVTLEHHVGQSQMKYRWVTDGDTFFEATNERSLMPLGQSSMFFQIYGAGRIKAFRVQRGVRSGNASTILANGGFPGAP